MQSRVPFHSILPYKGRGLRLFQMKQTNKLIGGPGDGERRMRGGRPREEWKKSSGESGGSIGSATEREKVQKPF